MPDSFMPDVVVEIAFSSGYTTPAASRTWTDVSQYVELADRIRIGFGRQDERSTADANSLTLTLDNSDGRFTAGRSASPYYPNVKLGRPIRVKVTPPGGTTSTRFVGFIDEWPVEWDGTDAYAKAQVRATSRLARLGLSATMRSTVEHHLRSNAPVGYWAMGDPAGATAAAESSSRTALTVVGGVTFGNATGPSTDGITAAAVARDSGGPTATGLTGAISVPAGPKAIRAAFAIGAAPTGGEVEIVGTRDSVSDRFQITVDTLGRIRGPLGMTGPSVIDGLVHDAALVATTTQYILYLDGAAVATLATSPAPACVSLSAGGSDPFGTIVFSCTVAHVAILDRALSAAEVAADASAVLYGFAGDRTDQRLTRVLGWVGVASSEVTTETGVETMTYQLTSGQSVVDALRECESTEGGVLFDGRDGTVTFHNRSHRYLATPAATLDMAAQHVTADYAPKLDRSTLVNDVEVSNPTSGQKARAISTTSSDEYGIATASATSVASTYEPLQQKAAWLIVSYAEPRTRVPSLTVDLLAHQGLTPSAQTLLGVTVGDLLAVTNAPSQSDSTSPSYFVEGYTEVIGPQSYEITFNLSPSYPTANTLILDSATRGLLDTNLLAF